MRMALAILLALLMAPAMAQQGCGPTNPNCFVPMPPNGDSSDRAASTRWVLNNVAGGGTLPAGTAGGIVYYTSSSAVASTVQLPLFAVVLGGGAGLTPQTVSGVGTTGQILTSQGLGIPPTWQSPAISTIGAGQITLGTIPINSASCTLPQTFSAAGVSANDVVEMSFNGDPTGITGFMPLTTGMLVIIPFTSPNTINVRVCNNTNFPITPGAVTLNWRVAR